MHSAIIEFIAGMVESACRKESNVFGYEVWTHHILNVVKFGKMLAEEFKADGEVVEIAALLHDYAGIMDSSLYDEHHYHGAVEAGKILERLDYPAEKIKLVKHCIFSHRSSRQIEKKTDEAICVASADAMAHIDQIPSLLHLAYSGYNMSTDEGVEWVRNKISRSWNKLCPAGKEIIGDKYNCVMKILDSN